jgi:hypothetical protein
MREPYIVAAELFGPVEQSEVVFGGKCTSTSEGSFFVNRNSTQENRFAVEKDLSAPRFDGAESDPVCKRVAAS